MFKVTLESDQVINAFPSGMSQNATKQLRPGTRVLLDLSPYRPDLGRIMKRLR